MVLMKLMTLIRCKNTIAMLALIGACLCGECFAEQPEPKIEVVATGMLNPCGIAIQPSTNTVYVCDSGHGKIVRLVDSKLQDVISGFAIETYGSNPGYKIGPLGIAFFTEDTLLVGEGGLPAGKDCLMSFRLSDKPRLRKECKSQSVLGPSPSNQEMIPEGNFYGLAIQQNYVFVTSHGDDQTGWIARAEMNDAQISNFQRFTRTNELNVHGPTAIVNTVNGNLQVSMFGETNVRNDGAIFEMSPAGKQISCYFTGLSDMTAIAYHPKNHQLYALDFSWIDKSKAGLFKLDSFDSNSQKCAATKVCDLNHPTAMAFDETGTLWVTEAGQSTSGTAKPSGRLLKITGLK